MENDIYYRRKLPHLQPRGGSIFVTFRLDFPIPERYLIAYNNYKVQLIKNIGNIDEKDRNEYIAKKMFAFVDDKYARCDSELSITGDDNVAAIIQNKILELQETHYYLYTFTLMPNHVHMLIKPNVVNEKPVRLSEIMRLLKGSTSRRVNQLLGREGVFWARESYDHWVRSQEELFNIFEYIRQNPVKAKLVNDANDWKWTWVNADYLV